MELSVKALGVWSVICIGVGYGLHGADLADVAPLVIAFGALVCGIVSTILRDRYDRTIAERAGD